MSKRKSKCTPEQWSDYLRGLREKRAANIDAHLQRDRDRSAKRWADPKEHDKRRDRHWRRLYGVGAEFIRALLVVQNGACAVCEAPLTALGKHVHVDHEHETMLVRGLLCRACNQAEGHIKTSGLTPVQFAERMRAYLDNPPARIVELVV